MYSARFSQTSPYIVESLPYAGYTVCVLEVFQFIGGDDKKCFNILVVLIRSG